MRYPSAPTLILSTEGALAQPLLNLSLLAIDSADPVTFTPSSGSL